MRQPDPQHEPLPSSIGGYRVLELLGQGGMGEVFRVSDAAYERELALKVCRRSSPNQVARFLAEAHMIGQLQHPAIPPLYNLGEDEDGRWFYAMKRVRSRTLQRVIELHRDPQASVRLQWNLKRVIGVVVSVCQAMAYVHSRGVIHRDLKPANIMIGNFGDVYILDWGIAKAIGRNLNQEEPESGKRPGVGTEDTLLMEDSLDAHLTEAADGLARPQHLTRRHDRDADADSPEASIRPLSHEPPSDTVSYSSSHLTLEGQVMGSLTYMSPEQARGEFDRHDQRSDIYAIGVMLWEILTGERFRHGLDKMQLLELAASGAHPDFPIAARGKKVEPVLRQICLKAIDPDPGRRHQAVVELADELQAWLDGVQPWKLVYESDFASLPDSDGPPPGWMTLGGNWRVRNGLLCIPEVSFQDSFLFIDKPITGDVRMEIEGWIEPGFTGELTMLIAMVPPGEKDKWRWAELEYRTFLTGFGGYFAQFGCDYHERSKIRRNGQEVVFSNATIKPGKKYRVLAEFLDGVLRVEVDGEEIMRLHDFFPMSGSRIGVYGYSGGVHLQKVRAWTPGVPKERSCLAVPNWLFSAGMWEPALKEYDLIRDSYPDSEESDEATFKSALCLVELERFDQARDRLEAVLVTAIAPLAYIGLSRLHVKRGGSIAEEGDLLIASLKNTDPELQGADAYRAWIFSRCQAFNSQGEPDVAVKVLRALHGARGTNEYEKQSITLRVPTYLSNPGSTWQEVFAAYRQVWTDHPRTSSAYIAMVNAGQMLQEKGQWQESFELFKQCLETAQWPHTKAGCHNRMAKALVVLGQCPAARAHLEAARDLAKTPFMQAEWLETHAWIFEAENRRQELVEMLQRILAECPDQKWACQLARAKLEELKG